jgi:ABC-2 type transport system permease protein
LHDPLRPLRASREDGIPVSASAVSLRSRPRGFKSGQGNDRLVERIRRVWEFRRILRLLVGRDLKVRYAGSALGYLWTVLEPLIMSLVYWFVFVKLIGRHIGYNPYIVFLLSGQLAWFWISSVITGSMRALRNEAQMVRSSNVPREIWVLRVVGSKAMEFLFSLPILAAFALLYRAPVTPGILLWPLGMLMSALLATGLALMFAPLAILVRDVERIVPPILRVLFYLSPILFSVEKLDERLRHVHLGVLQHVQALNPFTGIMEVFRATFFKPELRWRDVGLSAAVCLLVLVLGVAVFRRLERQMLKEI